MVWSNRAKNVSARETKGQEISKTNGHVIRIDDHNYKVKSQSSDSQYDVLNGELGWICSSHDHIYRGVKCKHI
jgi:hypothetical protein